MRHNSYCHWPRSKGGIKIRYVILLLLTHTYGCIKMKQKKKKLNNLFTWLTLSSVKSYGCFFFFFFFLAEFDTEHGYFFHYRWSPFFFTPHIHTCKHHFSWCLPLAPPISVMTSPLCCPIRFQWGWVCTCRPAPPLWSGRCLHWSSVWWCCRPCGPGYCSKTDQG